MCAHIISQPFTQTTWQTATATEISKTTIKQIYQTMTEDKVILLQLNDTLNQELELTLIHFTEKLFNRVYSVFMKPNIDDSLEVCDKERDT